MINENLDEAFFPTISQEDFFKIFDNLFSTSFLGTKPVNDINKSAEKNTLTLYGVITENIPDAIVANIAKQLEVKYAVAINTILENTFIDGNEANLTDYFSKKFKTNINISKTDVVDKTIDHLKEAVKVNTASATKNTNTVSNAAQNARNSHIEQSRDDMRVKRFSGATTGKSDVTNISKRDKDYQSTTGTLYRRSFTILDAAKQPHEVFISFRIRVHLLRTPSEKIISAVESAKNRDNLFNYMSMRAGKSSFFKDFILNLKEINKEVKRNISTNLEDRIIASMVRTKGFLTPQIFDNIESSHYFLILEKSDVEELDRTFKIDVYKAGNLRRIFDMLKILSLIVVNTAKQEMIIYDSDNPLKGNVVNYKKYDSESDMYNIYKAFTGR